MLLGYSFLFWPGYAQTTHLVYAPADYVVIVSAWRTALAAVMLHGICIQGSTQDELAEL